MKTYELREGFGFDHLVLADRPMPAPAPGQVLLKMRAWSLNYRDLLLIKGIYQPDLRLPMTPLSDGVGEVAAVGEGVARVKPGDRVAGIFMPLWLAGEPDEAKAASALGAAAPGVAAEYVVLDAEAVVPVPEHLSDAKAATLPCAAVTAWHALVTAGRIGPGHTVLTLGTGGVSLFALQFAQLFGARVLVTSSSAEKLERAAALGASGGIDYREIPEWGKRARELNGGRGVDHVVELGGAGTLGQSLRAVRMGGRISLIGILAGFSQFDPLPVLMKNICLQGIFVGSREMFEAMNAAIGEHRLKPVVDRVFPFAELPAALRYMEKGAHFGKIALTLE